MSNSKTHTVNITLEAGKISYDKPCFMAYPGDTIEWVCESDGCHFAVHLGWESPLPKGRYRPVTGKKTGDKVPKNAPPGRYKYFVAVSDGKNIWTDDPDFIVKRRP